MKEIVDRDVPTTRQVWSRDKAISHFKNKGEIYKAEIIELNAINNFARWKHY